MYDIMVQYMRDHSMYLTVKNLPLLEDSVVELCGVSVLVYCHFMYISRMCI